MLAASASSLWIGRRASLCDYPVAVSRRFDYTTRAGANRLRFVLRVLNYTRGTLLVLAAAIGVLFASAQARDIAAGMADGPLSWRACFVGSVLVLAWQVWWGARRQLNNRLAWNPEQRAYEADQFREARRVLEAERGTEDEARRLEAEAFLGFATGFAQYWPRVLAATVWLLAVLSVGLAQGMVNAWLWLLIGLGALMFTVLVCRRRPRIGGWSNPLVDDDGRERGWDAIVVGSTVLGIVDLVVSIGGLAYDPPGFSFLLGSMAVAFLILAALDFLLHLTVWWTREVGLRLYLILTVAFALSAGSVRCFGDNHGLRSLGEAPSTRPTTEEVLASWSEGACTVEDARPMVVVATSGGGLRASYWTTRVLTAIQAHAPSFRTQVVAISGASGGTLGGTLWVNWLRSFESSSPPASPSCAAVPEAIDDRAWSEALRRFYQNDYLAPVVAGMLYPDLLQRFVPMPVFPDRARFLERGWERGFAQVADGHTSFVDAPGLDAPFAELGVRELGSAEPWLPVLLINGTHQRTGARILTTPMAVESSVFPYSIDFYATNEGRDLPISTAAHNSARFAFFSPSGTLADGSGHIIDGGYAENYGAATALDLLTALARVRPEGSRLRPVVIQITNDSELACDYATPEAEVPREPVAGGLNDMLGPAEGILYSRNGRSALAGTMLADWTRGPAVNAFSTERTAAPVYAHFRLFETCGGDEPAPLGWVLSDQSRATMEAQLWCTAHNRAALQTVAQALTGARIPAARLDAICEAQAVEVCEPCAL